MHSVRRSSEPEHLVQLRGSNAQWNQLSPRDRGRIRRALSRDFNGICAYCEKLCDRPTEGGNSPDEETIDHFRPRSRFPSLSLNWLNFIYSCKRCNDAKGDQWPDRDDQVNQMLEAGYARFKPVSSYVNPNSAQGQCAARDFFDFDIGTGEIYAAEVLGDDEWSMAFRTIRDVDLNDSRLGEYTLYHLWNQRLNQLWRFIDAIETLDDNSLIKAAYEFTAGDSQFSSFVNTYFRRTFPMLYEIFPS